MRLTDHSVDVVSQNPIAMCYPSMVLPPTLPLLYPASLFYQPLPLFSDSSFNSKGVTNQIMNGTTMGTKTLPTKCESKVQTSQSNGKVLHENDLKSFKETTMKPSMSLRTFSPHLKKANPVVPKLKGIPCDTGTCLVDECATNVSSQCSPSISALPPLNSSLSSTYHRINDTFQSLPTHDLNASLLPFPFFSPFNLVSMGMLNNLETQTNGSHPTSPKMTSSEDTEKPWASQETIPFVYGSSSPCLHESFVSVAANVTPSVDESRSSPLLQHEIKSLSTPLNAKRCRSSDLTDTTVSQSQHFIELKPQEIVNCSPSVCSSTNQTKRKRRDVLHKKPPRVEETQTSHERGLFKNETTQSVPSLAYKKTPVPPCTTVSTLLTATSYKKDPSMCYRWRSDVLLTDERMSILPRTTTLQEDTTKELSSCHVSFMKHTKPVTDGIPKVNDLLGYPSSHLSSSFEPVTLDASFGGNPPISSCSQSTCFPCYDLLFSTTLQRIIEDTVFI